MARVAVPRRVKGSTVYPDSIPGLAVWLRSRDLVGLSEDNVVTTWKDNSKAGDNPASQTGINRPIYKTNTLNGFPSVKFDGINSFMNGKRIISPRSIFTLSNYTKSATFTTYDGLVTGQVSDNPNAGIIGDGGGTTLLWDESTFTGNFRVNGIATQQLGTLSDFKTVYIETPSAAYTSSYRLGQDRATTTRRWSGNVIEILMFTTVVSTSNILIIENYLRNEYGHY